MFVMEFLEYVQQFNPSVVFALLVGVLILKSLIPFIPFPKESVMIFSGLYFGVFFGSIINILGLVIGGLISFEIAYFGHDSLANRYDKITKMKDQLQERGWRMLITLRLIPISPQDVTSYASGISKIPRLQYYSISAIPFSIYGILLAYFGSFSLEWFF